ncbi:hypothetical protein [Sphingobium sp. WCS2017Hpa-17]|uniref:hypothetical protein n=1 Tax=Sphingobium sp. WCS2017Hpa-17 TaxID=3073638 RepID=UPI00288BDA33|nr:hypothetical protein [Sphingobium sp. WCS2017Hpa-17]
MTFTEEFESFASTLAGETISYFWQGYGSAIFLEIGQLTPRKKRDGSPGHPEGEISIGVKWSWRVEDARSIVCGSWSEDDLWEPAFSKLQGAQIESCELFGVLPEISLATKSGLRFLSFSTTDGQPQWHIVDRRHKADRWFKVRDGQIHLGDGTEPAF